MDRLMKGRPRGFDEEQAIDSAMRIFWEKSYEGATMADLTEATGLNRSSIHAAFGSKEGLFLKVVKRYWEGPLRYIPKALAEPTLPRVVEALIRGAVNFLSTPGNPKGCLAIHGALVCGTSGERVMQTMAEWRKTTVNMIKKRIQQGQREGELRGEVNAADYARYIAATMTGLVVQSLNGANRAELTRLADMTLQFLERSSFDPGARGKKFARAK
jgi:AcrR family transcriptional regulator